MASKRRIRRRQCEGKRRFATSQQATASVARVRRKGKVEGQINVYKCRFCGGYHWGHTPGQNSREG